LTREALREALADAEAFMTQILAKPEKDEENCLHTSHCFPCIPFTPETCKSKGNITDPCTSQGILDHLK